MNRKELGTYKRDALLGALGACLMLVGDLCLSVIPVSPTDSRLFDREAYLSGSWEPWRLPLLLATGLIGSLADWTSTLSPLLGREETAALIHAQYNWLMPAMLIAYAGMIVLILTAAYAVLTKKTFLPRGMFAAHMIVWQIVLVLIPAIRQACGAEISTWDFVLSQGSGNAALCIWMIANAIWAGRQMKKER